MVMSLENGQLLVFETNFTQAIIKSLLPDAPQVSLLDSKNATVFYFSRISATRVVLVTLEGEIQMIDSEVPAASWSRQMSGPMLDVVKMIHTGLVVLCSVVGDACVMNADGILAEFRLPAPVHFVCHGKLRSHQI